MPRQVEEARGWEGGWWKRSDLKSPPKRLASGASRDDYSSPRPEAWISGGSPASAEKNADLLLDQLEGALSADRMIRHGRGGQSDGRSEHPRISVLIFRRYMEAMHESMQSKDSRIVRLLRQLDESRAEAQILRLAPCRQGDPTDYNLHQVRLAASDREQLRAKDRMLQLYDEREEDTQRSMDQLRETIRLLLQRLDAVLAVEGSALPSAARGEIERVIQVGVLPVSMGKYYLST